MTKYELNETKGTILTIPCIQDTIIESSANGTNVVNKFTTAAGTDGQVFSVPVGEDLRLTTEYGNTSAIKFGGTDSWGYNRGVIELDNLGGSYKEDTIVVDNIEIDEYAGENAWCKCEKIDDNTLRYIALSANTAELPRFAYFLHSTTDSKIASGVNKDRVAASQWLVTVVQTGVVTTDHDHEHENQETPDNPNIPDNPDIPDTPDVPDTPTTSTLDEYINLFKGVDGVTISESKTPKTYAYLETMYNAANDEWNNNTHGFFDSSMYPELPEVNALSAYRGANSPSGVKTKDIFISWLFAMCLSEIMLTKSTSSNLADNNQTKLFRIAYNVSGGRSCPLYGGYSLKSDPTILRIAAAAVYVLVRGKKTFSYIDSLRSEINTKYSKQYTKINGSTWSDIDFQTTDYGYIPNKIGYSVNTDSIFPAAPGPYTYGHETITYGDGKKRDLPKDQGQPESLFYTGNEEGAANWWAGNYKVDVAIDDLICNNYIMAIPQGTNPSTIFNTWMDYSKDKRDRMINAVTAPYISDEFIYGSKKMRFDGVLSGKTMSFKGESSYYNPSLHFTYNNNTKYYDGTNGPVYKENGVALSNPVEWYFFNFVEDNILGTYTVSGPFADMHDIYFNNSSIKTFLKNVQNIGDAARCPSYIPDYQRRRRPLGGTTVSPNVKTYPESYNAARVSTFGDKRNGLCNCSITRYFTSENTDWNKQEAGDDWPCDKATSFPSGHSSQCMALALMIAQAHADSDASKIKQYISAAYEIGTGRTISRYHWQSDVMYGRLVATMIFPIINAMSGLEEGYNTLVRQIAPVISTESSVTYDNVATGIKIVLHNNTSQAMTIDSNMRFILRDGNQSIRTGKFELTSSDKINLAAQQSKTYNVILSSNDQAIAARELHFATTDQLYVASAGDTYTSNILTYVDGVSHNKYPVNMDSTYVFKDNATYDIYYGTESSPNPEPNPEPTPTPIDSYEGNVTTTVTIINNSDSSKTIDSGKSICFITYGKDPREGETYTGYFRFYAICSGANRTIPAGGSQTYTATFVDDDRQTPKVALNTHFANQAQRGQFQSNNGYYISGSCYTCNDFNTTDTFREGGSYTMTIPANTHEWSSNS